MYEETPVIAVNTGGPRETIVHNETGILCDQNAQSFSQAMLTMMMPVCIPIPPDHHSTTTTTNNTGTQPINSSHITTSSTPRTSYTTTAYSSSEPITTGTGNTRLSTGAGTSAALPPIAESPSVVSTEDNASSSSSRNRVPLSPLFHFYPSPITPSTSQQTLLSNGSGTGTSAGAIPPQINSSRANDINSKSVSGGTSSGGGMGGVVVPVLQYEVVSVGYLMGKLGRRHVLVRRYSYMCIIIKYKLYTCYYKLSIIICVLCRVLYYAYYTPYIY